MLANRRSIRPRRSDKVHSVPATADDRALLAELVVHAREALLPLADCELDCAYPKLLKAHKPIGSENGAGIHIRVANVALDADGCVSSEELARFVAELADIRDSLTNCFSTLIVSQALLLTILVVLFLASPYDRLEAGASEAASIWDSDAIAWLSGSDNDLTVRHAFHTAEAALLAACILGCLAGFFLSQCQLVIVSALPGNLAMVEYLLKGGLKPIFTLYMCVDLPFLLTPIALPFVAARYSALAFVAAIALLVGCYALWCPFMHAESQPLMLQNRTLQRWARMAVARTQAERANGAAHERNEEQQSVRPEGGVALPTRGF